MADDDITNKVLLDHMQGMKYELQQQLSNIETRVGGLAGRIGSLETKVISLDQKIEIGFEEARQHRNALQEDLNASIAMLYKHKVKLDKITV